jgi:hypothetical protein
VHSQRIIPAEPASGENNIQFLGISDLKDQFSRCDHGGKEIEFHIEGPLKQFGENIGKLPAFGDNTDAFVIKTVAEQQNTKTSARAQQFLLGILRQISAFAAAEKDVAI